MRLRFVLTVLACSAITVVIGELITTITRRRALTDTSNVLSGYGTDHRC
ncbi:hypothetical protein [Nocardia xishanensis]|nr:hypothetical protein [Nocardia xishanensis]